MDTAIKKVVVAIYIASLSLLVLKAKELWWNGTATTSTWTTNSTSWIDISGNDATFENGDDVHFSTRENDQRISVIGKINVGKVYFDSANTNTYTFWNHNQGNAQEKKAWEMAGINGIMQSGDWIKEGSNAVTFIYYNGSFTNDIYVKCGTVTFNGNISSNYHNDLPEFATSVTGY